jgi:exodeoxyribonuclease VII large subunit
MEKALSVSQLNEYIKNLIASDDILENLTVEGEISNCTLHYSGHIYFSIKDKDSSIRCVMFAGSTKSLKFKPEDGIKVCVFGYLSFYEKSGQCQIIVTAMLKSGAGDLFLKFEELKAKLLAEGLFDNAHKKAIPYLSETIGVITSKTGAVLQDIRNVLNRRFENYSIMLYPSQVQGKDAHKTIIKGIEYFNEHNNVDVIIIARGGGSVEDLWPFNEEELAYAIYNSTIPIISAIGHEVDFTIADFVSDLRAPTPSAAAELVLPDKASLKKDIAVKKDMLDSGYRKLVTALYEKVRNIQNRPVMKRPEEYTNILAMNLDNMSSRLMTAGHTYLDHRISKFDNMSQRLEALCPMNVLKRGYSITTDSYGHVITMSSMVSKGTMIYTETGKGSIQSVVEKAY